MSEPAQTDVTGKLLAARARDLARSQQPRPASAPAAPEVPSGPLTRETRYAGRAWVNGSALHDVRRDEPVRPGDTGLVELTFCLSCGSPVVVGREDGHEQLHAAPA
jgi:hypothetical protein